jgi:hypothetical protein
VEGVEEAEGAEEAEEAEGVGEMGGTKQCKNLLCPVYQSLKG